MTQHEKVSAACTLTLHTQNIHPDQMHAHLGPQENGVVQPSPPFFAKKKSRECIPGVGKEAIVAIVEVVVTQPSPKPEPRSTGRN